MNRLTPPATGAGPLAATARRRVGLYLDDLKELVHIDSGSYSAAGVDAVGDWFQQRLQRAGFTTERVTFPPREGVAVGRALVARRTGGLAEEHGGRRILLAGHMDTVFDDGTAAGRPFDVRGTLAHGPGVSDDKGGLLAGLHALEILREEGIDTYAELVFLATPDEEIGSPASRPLTEATAHGMHYALALECARENGDLVFARKGVADFLITVRGHAAHAGIEPERGANAALAAAHLTIALQALNGHLPDVTVNVGVLNAGTRTNIVCPQAVLRAEIRAATLASLDATRQALERAAAHLAVPGTTAVVEQLDLCPPMEDTPASRALLTTAQAVAAGLDLTVGAAATGGVGDANLIAGTGVPVLDGLGPVGGADHTPEEWLDVTTIAPRIALLATLVAALGNGATPASHS
ncbi:glutamate carboxypeptidase [Streptomyces sp. 3330]|uniref:M20 family metallopeptidase n=1 Tax=Streptomyces sp. 3330 TaxID=2817755 RepID=UPI00285B8C3D|nr:M20 family metallopeptidase [Streptomyces sp. 3330]MDR6980739.1 glutamate carboxypeptidase [Streptomyces sp. 3330]